MTFRNRYYLISFVFFLTGCSLFAPQVQTVKAKDIINYKKIGTDENDCLNMNEKSCELFKLINVYRKNKQLPAFIAIENCINSAQSHSENMYVKEELKHDLSDSKWNDRIKIHRVIGETMAENVALASTASQVVDKWIHSTNHYNNIINPNFTHIGYGQKGRYWTQCFLKPFQQ